MGSAAAEPTPGVARWRTGAQEERCQLAACLPSPPCAPLGCAGGTLLLPLQLSIAAVAA